jgi:hypothetical protein
MSILSSQLVTTGLADSPTSLIFLKTSDTLSGVQAAGYLTLNLENLTYQLSPYQLAVVYTTDAGTVLLQVSFANNVWSLVNQAVTDVVATPTVANQIAYATNTGGSLAASGLSTALFNAGNISAGLSGTAGALESYSSTALRGALALQAVANTGNTNVTISNVAFGQASTLSFADIGSAAGRFLVANTATPFTNGNFPKASGTGGLMVDSGIAVSNLMQLNAANVMTTGGSITLLKATGTEASNAVTASGNAGVITTSSLTTAGAGTYSITWTNTSITATSVINLQWQGGTNTTANFTMSVVAGSGSATLVIHNNTAATALNGTIIIGFAVL